MLLSFFIFAYIFFANKLSPSMKQSIKGGNRMLVGILILILAVWAILMIFGDIVGWLAHVIFAAITISAVYLLVDVILKILKRGKEND